MKKHKYFWPKEDHANILKFGYTPRYYVTHPIKFIKDVISRIRYAKQRIKYGFCVADTWNIDYWLTDTLPYMLRDLAYNTNSVPCDMTSEDWKRILLNIASDLEQGDKDKCEFENPYAKKFDMLLEHPNRFPKEEAEEIKEGYYKGEIEKHEFMNKAVQNALRLIGKYYNNLWD